MSRRKLLIHIGMGKTGTTSIQRTLGGAAGRLLRSGISYPVIEKLPHHNHIPAIYLPFDRTTRQLRSKEDRDSYAALGKRYRAQLFAKLRSCGHAILSAESLFRFPEEDIEKFHQDICGLDWGDIRVVAYIREPSSHYLSSVQQRLKGSASVPSPITWFHDSYARLSNWRRHFPVSAYAFNRRTLARQCVVSDFLQHASEFFDVPLRPEDMALEISNVSLSAEAMIVMQRYRKFFFKDVDNRVMPASDHLVRILAESATEFQQTKPALKRELALHIARTHAPMLEKLEREYDLKFDLLEGEATTPSGQEREYNVEDIVERYDPEMTERLLWHALHRSLGKVTAGSHRANTKSKLARLFRRRA